MNAQQMREFYRFLDSRLDETRKDLDFVLYKITESVIADFGLYGTERTHITVNFVDEDLAVKLREMGYGVGVYNFEYEGEPPHMVISWDV